MLMLTRLITLLQALEASRAADEARVAAVSATKIQAVVRGRLERKV